MNFFVIELQTNADGTSGNIVRGYAERNDAEQAYLTTRAAAAISAVMIHTVLWIDNRGNVIEKIDYTHPVELEESEA